MFVKICGITTPDAVAAAVDAGADAVGFVFAPSARQVDVATALELCRGLPEGVIRVAVMRHPDAALVEQVLAGFRPDWLQTDAGDFAAIELRPGCTALPVYRGAASDHPARILFEGPVSGSGRTADWREARRLAAATKLVLAGGLNADNVGAAIDAVRPWGVDVSSGVERAPGLKDPAKIARFIAAARAAAQAAGLHGREAGAPRAHGGTTT